MKKQEEDNTGEQEAMLVRARLMKAQRNTVGEVGLHRVSASVA